MRHNRILHSCFRFILSRPPSFYLSCLPAFLLIVFLSNQFACQSTMICVSVCLCLSVTLSVCLSLCLCALLLTVFFFFCLPVCVSVCCVTLCFCWDFSEASARTCFLGFPKQTEISNKTWERVLGKRSNREDEEVFCPLSSLVTHRTRLLFNFTSLFH